MTEAELRALILFENADFIGINKPAGLLVHPVAADSVALTQFLPLLGEGLRLCHRLDRETSGCLLLGKTEAAVKSAGRLFMHQKIGKKYLALVSPAPEAESGSIDLPLKKIAARMRPAPDGQAARTDWLVLERRAETALLQLTPKTGRTHQLRAHLSAQGWPILGDRFYDGQPAPRLMLHAAALTLPGFPPLTAPLPEEFIGFPAQE